MVSKRVGPDRGVARVVAGVPGPEDLAVAPMPQQRDPDDRARRPSVPPRERHQLLALARIADRAAVDTRAARGRTVGRRAAGLVRRFAFRSTRRPRSSSASSRDRPGLVPLEVAGLDRRVHREPGSRCGQSSNRQSGEPLDVGERLWNPVGVPEPDGGSPGVSTRTRRRAGARALAPGVVWRPR